MANFFSKLKSAFTTKEDEKDTSFIEAQELKPVDANELTLEQKSNTCKIHTVTVEQFREDCVEALSSIKANYNYGDMCLIYVKGDKTPVMMYQYRINGWERI